MSYPYLQQPRPEQLEAMRKIHRVKHVLVAGDMGVGKTKIAVDFIANMVWHNKLSRAVAIMPSEAIGVWEQQISDNCPFLDYSLFIRGEEVNWNAHVVIINYDYLCPRLKKKKPTARAIQKAALTGKKLKKKHYVDKRILELVIAWSPEVVVIDEGHKIKRPTARRSKAIHALGPIAEYTIDLTGTPTGNKKVMDLWSQFRFIKRGLLCDDFKEFKQEYGIWTGFGGFTFVKARNLKKLSRIIGPYTIRIKKTGLPEEIPVRYPVVMPPHAREIYKQMEEEFVAYVSGQNVVASIVLTKMMKLSQIAGGFIKNEKKEDLPIHTAKIDAFNNILDEIQENGTNRVIVFARFLWEIAEVKKALNQQGWNNIYRVSGRVPRDVMDRFNDEGGAMVCQTASGSGSNNFQASNYAIFYSTDYSLINYQQAKARIHRGGQTKPCWYYFLQCRGTIDVRIFNLLENNKDAAEEILALMEEIKSDHCRGNGREW
jgi:SNF2 family DNA or RNA helicase